MKSVSTNQCIKAIAINESREMNLHNLSKIAHEDPCPRIQGVPYLSLLLT